jgi:hypothetical protein
MPPLVKPISFSVASSSARKGWRADWDLALDTAFLASHRCIMGLVAEISVMLFAGAGDRPRQFDARPGSQPPDTRQAER